MMNFGPRMAGGHANQTFKRNRPARLIAQVRLIARLGDDDLAATVAESLMLYQ